MASVLVALGRLEGLQASGASAGDSEVLEGSALAGPALVGSGAMTAAVVAE